MRTYRLSDILIGIHKMGKTGILEVAEDTFLKNIYFSNGDAIFSSSDNQKERMGTLLREIGKITPDDYRSAVEIMKKTGKRLGAAFVEHGCLTPGELVWAVQYQVEKIILNLFNLDDGSFLFRETPLPIKELITLKLGIRNLVYRGIKSIQEFDKIRNFCPSPDSVLNIPANAPRLYQELSLDEHERKVFSLFDGRRTIKEILSQSPLSREKTLQIIYGLFSTQVIEGDTPERVINSVFSGRIKEQSSIDPAFADKIEKLYRNHLSLGYYGILDIPRNVTTAEIKRAYHKLVKEFHPDKHLHSLSDELRIKLHHLFAYLNEAYRNLTQKKTMPNTAADSDAGSQRDNKQIALQKFNEGRRHLSDHNYEQALLFLGQALYLDDSVAKYHYFYGMALLKNKKMKPAEESLKKALQLDPSNADYIASLGHIYLQLGFKARARNTFENALKVNPLHKRASEGLKESSI